MPGEPLQGTRLCGEGDAAALRAAFPPDGDPDRALLRPDCRLVKLQDKVIVGRMETPAGAVFVKRYNVFAWRVALGSLGTDAPAVRASRNAAALRALGFETPAVLGALEERRAGLLRRSFFVTREALGDTADCWWQRLAPGPAGADGRRRLAQALGELFRRLHAAGVYHADLKDVNILVREEGRTLVCTLLDLERVRFGAVSDRLREKNLTQLSRTLGRHARRIDQARFLRSYLGADASRDLRRRWASRVGRQAAAKDRRAIGIAPTAAPVSATVVCQNESRHLRRCLESVAWCDEVVVVDGGSTDDTVAIAREFTPRTLEHAWPGYRAQKQYAMDHASQPWVLSLDADERVTNELAAEMRRAVAAAGDDVGGFAVPRLVPYLGRWWYRGGWYPRRVVRLVRRDRARWGGVDPHDRLEASGRIVPLRYPIVHYTYADVAAHLRTVVRFSQVAADERPGKIVGWGRLLGEPAWRFVRSWIVRAGWREGFPGFFVAATDAFYTFLRFAILWQRRHDRPRDGRRR